MLKCWARRPRLPPTVPVTFPSPLSRAGPGGCGKWGAEAAAPPAAGAYVMPGQSPPVRPAPSTLGTPPAAGRRHGGPRHVGPLEAPPCPTEGGARDISHCRSPTSLPLRQREAGLV